ncbi:MarR family winged helix-turn-helix transcriptional regulator [Streptomyces sp. NBC_00344]|uniref:MarR family winged helix-turn-helix transcriptional regulator n=1 Tax=Streptomyces sp. NBC_00344 TaxID=2975720 RepID=UPI002E1A41EB
MEDGHLSQQQLRVLASLRQRPGINLTALARGVGLSLPRASRVCSGLESAGLLSRSPADSDRREIGLALTPGGIARLERVEVRRVESLVDALGRMPARDRRGLVAGCRYLASSLTAMRAGGD